MINIFLVSLVFICSLIILIKGANFLIKGAVNLAKHLKVKPILIGLTIVAFGTSLPELMVSLFAVLTGSMDISVGNIIGSNIANIGLVIGFSALFVPLIIKSETLTYEFPLMTIASFLFLLLANDHYLFNKESFSLGRIDGLIFLTLFIIFIHYIYRSAKKQRGKAVKEFKEGYTPPNPLWKNILLITGGIIMLGIGGRLFVNSASNIARYFGLSEAFIGTTIVALGTSLPELFTSLVAAWKRKPGIAVGNIVGSNIFNILFVLGLVSLVKPIIVNPQLLFVDGMIMVGITLLFSLFAATSKKITRTEGLFLLLSYLAYIGYLIWNL